MGPGAAHVRDSPDGPEKGPPTSPLLNGGTRRVVAHNEKPGQKAQIPKTAQKEQKSPKSPKMAKNAQIDKKGGKMAKMVKISKMAKKG